MATVIDKAVEWTVNIANDDSHGYSMDNRTGNPDYDCSSLICTAWSKAGLNINPNGTTYTMKEAFSDVGFSVLTEADGINFSTGAGLQKGDVLLNVQHHTEMMISETERVGAHSNYDGIAGDSSGEEINIKSYSNYVYGWQYVLRYPGGSDEDSGGNSSEMTANWVEREVPNIGKSLATKSYMAYQTYTDSSSGGYGYLWGENSHTISGGLRKYKDFFCMAFGSYYGPDGTFFKIEFDDGKIMYAVKADEKKDSETDSRHMYHASIDNSVTEFIVDNTKINCANVNIGNGQFTSALSAESINRSARITAIWTSDSEPTYGTAGTTSEKEYHFTDTNEKIPLHPTIFKQVEMVCNGQIKMLVNDLNISQHIGDLSWTNSKATLATTMAFSTPKPGDMKYMNMYMIWWSRQLN